ncbi:site-specific DNA-methyltransferase [Candidatus Woesearchaeota archaeon]|nr:MAG: site-specific DNA-methyltransferase [Candidatus Woesearchaeota archaeon]
MTVRPYYEKGNFKLYHGDCVDVMKSFPAESFDMIFADPPYHLSNGGFTCHGGKRVSVNKGEWDRSMGAADDFNFHLRWIKACRRVLKKNGTIWISGTYHSIYACGFALQLAGYRILNDITWYKPNASPNLGCRCFTASHESLIWASKDPDARHTFNYDAMKNGNWHERDMLKKQGKQMRSVWSIATPKQSEKKSGKHPAQKPEELLRRIILAATDEGDLILDPFTGSSTTGMVACMHCRGFVGVDTEKDYLDLSVRRFESVFCV